MSGGGGAEAAAAIVLPEGQITSVNFDITSLPPINHIFFDDDVKFIVEANVLATDGIPITTVLCPDTEPITLYGKDNEPVIITPTKPGDYIKQKMLGVDSVDFKGYLTHRLKSVSASAFDPNAIKAFGAGLTTDMIRKIIGFEREQSERTFKRIYFFDFDKVLNQTASIAIDKPEIAGNLDSYAKYIFSNYVGDEQPADGRLTLLKEMFGVIGIDRIYIITSNPMASDANPPHRGTFCNLLQKLLPVSVDAWGQHLISTYSKNMRGYKNKHDAIRGIIEQQSARAVDKGGRARRQKKSTGIPKRRKSKKIPRTTKRASRIRGGSRHKRTHRKFRK